MKNIGNLKVNNLKNPLGYDYLGLNFSWEYKAYAESVRLIISKDTRFSNIIFKSDYYSENATNAYIELELEPKTRYFWMLQSANHNNKKSSIAWFETSKMGERWVGNWIASNNLNEESVIFRKDVTFEKKPIEARIYASGYGLYEVEINGKKVGNEYLSPGYYSYDGYHQYQTHIIDNLKMGDNQIGVILGNGWYKGRFGFDGGYTNLYGDKLTFIAEIHVLFDDGTEEIIKTDESWYFFKSPIFENNLYDGEVVHGNMHFNEITSIKADQFSKRVKLNDKMVEKPMIARKNVPITMQERLDVKEATKLDSCEWILDFGQNMAGWVEFNVHEIKGKKVVIQYAEHFQNGDIYIDNLRTAKSKFVYHSHGIKETVRPRFTFFGFRYVKISGITNFNKNDFTACVIHSNLKVTGNLETGNEKLNKFIQNTLWSQKGNFIDIPTDCPQRDEKMGWTGDAQIFINTASFNMNVSQFFAKYMYDLNYEQTLINGAVPNIVPRLKLNEFNGFIDGYAASPWADSATIIPWELYVKYGDKNLLREQYVGMKAWVDYVYTTCKSDGNEYLWTQGFHFADWLALDNHKDPYSTIGATEPYYVASIFYYHSTLIVAKAAKTLGLEDYSHYSAMANNIRKAIIAEYFSENGRITIDTQTARILAINFDLLPEKKLKRLGDELVQMIVDNDMHLDTGFIGTPYICNALEKTGHVNYAYNLLLKEDYPSWLYSVNQGATTVWERWDSLNQDGIIAENGMNSLNHYAYGAIVSWIYEGVAGIKKKEHYPGFEKYDIHPNIEGRLKFVDASYKSQKGLIRVFWEVLATGEIKVSLKVPVSSSANLRLPKPKDIELLGISQKIVEDDDFIYFDITHGDHEFLYEPVADFIPKYNIEMSIEEILSNGKTEEIFLKYFGENLKIESHMLKKPLILLAKDYRFNQGMNKTKINSMMKELEKIEYQIK